MKTKKVKIGSIYIGGGEKIAVQSMITTLPKNENSIKEILRLEKAGCDIVRFAVKDELDAKAIKGLKEKTNIPLVADIHFDYKLAIASIENGADKIRINPGNIGSDEKVKAVASCLKEYGVPVRVGANTGSIEKDFYAKYGSSAKALGESALKNVKILEKQGVNDIVISVKASSVPLMVESAEYINKRVNYPLHLGVTEAGGGEMGVIKNSIGIGSLLLKGIGDTIRVSLSGDTIDEVRTGKNILRAVGLDKNFADVIACPTCGRCEWDLMEFYQKVEKRVKDINKPIKIAVMGCVVNGPGEAKEADIGIAGGEKCVIFKKGEIIKIVEKDKIEEEFFKELEECLK
ncbi:MAG: flavodoxin-dependent (E)-4-hydroxy-3-methylbut-2-enyl-diphosphate synthase [Clostridiales bacterium]|nr:flavodoxin-dependent (E)-4-hydroxy-3-methylbut-2-enyl-diphosphate synthase [Clostridiales bacterium]